MPGGSCVFHDAGSPFGRSIASPGVLSVVLCLWCSEKFLSKMVGINPRVHQRDDTRHDGNDDERGCH